MPGSGTGVTTKVGTAQVMRRKLLNSLALGGPQRNPAGKPKNAGTKIRWAPKVMTPFDAMEAGHVAAVQSANGMKNSLPKLVAINGAGGPKAFNAKAIELRMADASEKYVPGPKRKS